MGVTRSRCEGRVGDNVRFTPKADMAESKAYVRVAPQADTALFIQLPHFKPSSPHRACIGNHVSRYFRLGILRQDRKDATTIRTIQSVVAGSTCRTLRCFQQRKLKKSRSWSRARSIYTAQLSTTQLFARTASYMFVEISSAI